MAKSAKIIDHRRIPSPNPKRLGKTDVLDVVEVEGGVRLVIRLPAEDYTDEKLKVEIKDQLQERGQNIGREIEL